MVTSVVRGRAVHVAGKLRIVSNELLRRGLMLEYATLAWSVVGVVVLAIYIAVQSAITLISGTRPGHSTTGIIWLAVTVVAMLLLAAGKRDTGHRLGNSVLQTESRVTQAG